MVRLPFLSILLVTLSNFVLSQEYYVESLTEENGLPSSGVSCIEQDKRGFLWIGTHSDGLVRYDGISFKCYNKSNGFINDNIVDIAYDSLKDELWIATFNDGIYLYNGQIFAKQDILNDSLIVNEIYLDYHSNLWIATIGKGLLCYHPNKTLSRFTECGVSVRTIYADRDHNLWLGSKFKGIVKYDYNEFKYYPIFDKNNIVISSIVQDSQNTIYAGLYKSGLYKLNQDTFYKVNLEDTIFNFSTINLLSVENTLLVSHNHYGITILDHNDSIVFSYPLADTFISTVFRTKDKSIWIAGKYLHRLTAKCFAMAKLSECVDNQNIKSFIVDDKSKINWILNYKEVIKWDVVRNACEKISLPYEKTFKDAVVMPNGGLLIITNPNGLFFINDNRLEELPEILDTLKTQLFSQLFKDSNGNIWLAVVKGIYKYTGDELIEFRLGKRNDFLFQITAIGEGKDGDMLITINNKFYRIRESTIDTFPYSDYLHNKVVTQIIEVSPNNYWFNTLEDGLLNLNNGKLTKLNAANGLSANSCYGALFDSIESSLWIITSVGLDRIIFDKTDKSYSTFRIKNYGNFEGVESKFDISSIGYYNQNLLLGTNKGMFKYDQINDQINRPTIITYISNIKLDYQYVEDWSAYSDSIIPWLTIPYNLKLTHDKNHITFQLAAVNLRNPHTIKFKWKLEGIDNDWSPASSNSEAVYSSIAPGKYVFKVKACNETGEWNDMPTEYSFEISPPYWQTWWFRLLVVVIIGLLIWRLLSLRIQQEKLKAEVIRKQLESEKKLISAQNQMLELEQQALRAQMNPHFIFNALNSIQGFIASNKPDVAERFLSRFAKLMRLILESSREKLYPLEKELQMLQYYLDIQRLCYNNKFDFKIYVDPHLQAEQISIPPMLIQPYIENAIVHGIINLENSNGHIDLSCIKRDEYLIFEIKDNGVGRYMAQQLKIKHQNTHQSVGLLITKERIDIFNNENEQKINVEIIDLKDDQNNATGTKVILTVPLQYSL